jgi:type IV pilus assembly protein PilW
MKTRAKLASTIRLRRAMRGFTLVEIMVGMTIALLGVIIMAQTNLLFESQKRSTTGGGDAQNTAAIALFQLQRDLRQAGYGIANMPLLGCDLTLLSGRVVNIQPVRINPAGVAAMVEAATGRDTGTDAIILMYASGNGAPEGESITAVPNTTTYAVANSTDFSVNDLVVAASNMNTNVLPATKPVCTGVGALSLQRVTAVTAPNITVAVANTAMANQGIYDLGAALTVVGYMVRKGVLRSCDFVANNCADDANVDDPAIWVPVADNIAAVRFQYGRETTTAMQVSTWDQTALTTACDIAKARMVRFGLLARNAQYEKSPVTNTTSTTNLAAPYPTWNGLAFDLPGNTAEPNWQNYRYRVMQAVVPMRNIAWIPITGSSINYCTRP